MAVTLDGSNGITTPQILNAGANGSGNIGSANSYFGTLFVTNTTLTNFSATGNITTNQNLSVGGTLTVSGTSTLTGVVTAPTASAATNNTQVATTAFVRTATNNLNLGTISTQNANNVTITGGTINGVTGTAAGLTVGNATNAVTATNASQFQNKTKLGLGITGEVWNNVTGSRSAGVTYTNTNSYPIQFAVSAQKIGDVNSQGLLEMYVNGALITRVASRVGNNMDHNLVVLSSVVIVPPGQTYRISLNGDTFLILWNELY